MKTLNRFFLILLLLTVAGSVAFAQLGISYQAVLRDSDGKALINQSATLRVKLTNSTGSSVYYSEDRAVTTNAYGMVSFVIGSGVVTNVTGVYGNVPWKDGNIYLGVDLKISGASSFTEFEKQKLQAVPYALHAANAEPLPNGAKGQTLAHDGTSWVANGTIVVTDTSVNIVPVKDHDPEKPIFSVLNSKGQTVFAVYETGVRSFVGSDGGKGTKGGFAVGGLSGGKGIVEYLKVSPDSVRIYIESATTSDVKGTKGGFAVGGLSGGKGAVEYLRVTRDSARIYIDDSTPKGTKGGFAVGGLSGAKSPSDNYFKVTQDSTYFTNTILSTGDMLVAGNVSTNVGITETALRDSSGNVYKTIKIGEQVWMAENLKTTKFSDGSLIPVDSVLVYNNSVDPDTLNKYGRLYHYGLITLASNVCPTGWHVPTAVDWKTLFSFVGGAYYENNTKIVAEKISEAGFIDDGTGLWQNQQALFFPTNTTGFSARPGGSADYSGMWYSSGIAMYATFWAGNKTVPELVRIEGYMGDLSLQEGSTNGACSIRCIKD